MKSKQLSMTSGSRARAEAHQQSWLFRLAAIGVVLLTVPPTIWQGRIRQRWGVPPAVRQEALRWTHLPNQCGDWSVRDEGQPLSAELTRLLELESSAQRVYENRRTGQAVTVLVMAGPAGPLTRHPPEICYASSDNRRVFQGDLLVPGVVEQGQESPQFRLLEFERAVHGEGHFLVAYAFGAEGTWTSPRSPRMALGGLPLVCKMQVLAEGSDELDSHHPTGLTDFLRHFLPALAQHAGSP